MLDYLRFRNQSCDPLLKFYFKKEVDEYLIDKDLLHYFNGHLPCKISAYEFKKIIQVYTSLLYIFMLN